jgi:hypothetical protein
VASAWGGSWGSAWGSSWGGIAPPPTTVCSWGISWGVSWAHTWCKVATVTGFAFQRCAFQVSPAFQADVCGPVRKRVGYIEGGTSRRQRKPDPWEKTLTRRHWKELQDLIHAEVDAAIEATRRNDPVLAIAADAAQEAAEALYSAPETEIVNRDANRVIAALNAAVAAKTETKRRNAARRAEMEAKALSHYLALLEDDEECELLLLN